MVRSEVFTRLAFLGMPQDDVARFVDLTTEFVTSGAQGRASQAEVKKLVRTLSRRLGKPRADLFVKWLTWA